MADGRNGNEIGPGPRSLSGWDGALSRPTGTTSCYVPASLSIALVWLWPNAAKLPSLLAALAALATVVLSHTVSVRERTTMDTCAPDGPANGDDPALCLFEETFIVGR